MIELNQNNDTKLLRLMVSCAYDAQKLRIQIGNRIVREFQTKMGMEFSNENFINNEQNEEVKKLLVTLCKEYDILTNGIVNYIIDNPIKEKEFKSIGHITTYGEFSMVNNYVNLLNLERKQFKDIENQLKKIPIYKEYLKDVTGVGPAMAGVIISYFDIHKAMYPSSLVAYAGMDTVLVGVYHDKDGKRVLVSEHDLDPVDEHDDHTLDRTYKGIPVTLERVGRSMKSHCLVDRPYIDKYGHERTKKSITFNPILKSKLLGVLGPSFIKSQRLLIDGKKTNIKELTELAISKGLKDKKPKRHTVIEFLQMLGYEVTMTGSPYAKIYYDYKHRLANNPIHKDKSELHLHNMAIRYCVKMFLQDLYNNWRTIEGLPVAPTYAEAKLGIKHGELSPGKLID